MSEEYDMDMSWNSDKELAILISCIKSPLWIEGQEDFNIKCHIREFLQKCSGGKIVKMLKSVLSTEEKSALVKIVIKEETSESKISDKADIMEEVIEPLVHEYEKAPIEFPTNSNVKCQTCGLEFGNKAVLKIHNSMVHPEGKEKDQNKIRLETIDVIENSIPKNEDLNPHTSIHKGVKNNVVQKQTKRPTALNRHIKSVHDGKKSFKCSACNFETAKKITLKKHMESVHEDFKCKICEYKTAEKRSLKIHMQYVHEGANPYI